MDQQVGSGSLCFAKAPFIIGTASVVGTKEGEGPLADAFDCIGPDDKFGQQTWEAAESSLQKEALTLALGKADQKPEDMRYLFAGDLLGQLIASSFGLKTFEIPLFGLYGACSTCGEALALSAMTVAAGYADRVAAVTSSHFASAEKQFRFPLEYANQRPVSATWTVTGGGAFILSKDAKQPLAKVAGVTTGKIVDYGIKDSMNMGAVMAPAAAELIAQNLTDFKRKPEDYDRIITGDLGEVGQQILFDLLLKLANTAIDSDKVAEKIADEARDDTPQALDAVWEEEQVKFFAEKGCGDSAITAHQRRFAGAVAPQYLNITTGGQH